MLALALLSSLLLPARSSAAPDPARAGARPATALAELQPRRLPETIAGVPVRGGGLYQLIGQGGRVIWQHDARHPELQAASLRWTLDARQALDVAVAWERGFVPRPALDARLARKVILPLGFGVALPLWRVHLPPVRGLAYNPVIHVDATSGRVLRAENRIWTAGRVRVFAGNPVSTPDVMEDVLPWLEAPAPGSKLSAPLLRTFNCPDRHELFDVRFMGMQGRVHLCSEVQLATADAQGDFLYPADEPNDPEDLFAEAHMFYHVAKIYQKFQQLGFEELDQVPLRAVVNFRIPNLLEAFSPDSELEPFDNAFFLPAGDLRDIIEREEDSIVFGQGSRVDFAYDADVIYHEFGHAVVDTVAGLEMAALDRWGVSLLPGALHEGYADIFSIMMTGDPLVGEYAGSGFGEDRSAIRDVAGDARFPEDQIGQVHEDSLPWSGALWQVRQELAALGHSVEDVELAVFKALGALSEVADFAMAAEATLAAIGEGLGADAAAHSRRIMEARGVTRSDRVLQLSGKEMLLLPGKAAWGLDNYAPGAFQFQVPTEPEHGRVVVEFLLPQPSPSIPGFGGGLAEPMVMVRAGGQPIELTYEPDGLALRTKPRVDRIADAVDQDEGKPSWPHRLSAVLPFRPGHRLVHVMIGNRGDGEVFLGAIRITTEVDPDNPWNPPDAGTGVTDGGAGESDAGAGETDVSGVQDAAEPGADSGGSGRADAGSGGDGRRSGQGGSEDEGCSCAATAGAEHGGAAGGMLVIGLAAWLLPALPRRRRSRA